MWHRIFYIYIVITLEKTKIIFKIFFSESLPYKPRNLGIKTSHGCIEIAFCPVGYFNLSHPVYYFLLLLYVSDITSRVQNLLQ